MTEIKYQTFWDAKYTEIIEGRKLDKELFDLYISATANPDIDELLSHQRKQYEIADAAGQANDCWPMLDWATNEAEKAISTGNIAAIASAFLRLGEATERLKHPSDKEMIELRKSHITNLERERPLMDQNGKKNFLKGCAEIIAKRVWREDLQQKIKVSEACEHVWADLISVASKYSVEDQLPDKSSSLKDWLRPIAPEYAKKGGRPKNKP